MYLSDYGYAVGGEVRGTCLEKSMVNYDSGSCNTNDWLKPNIGTLWTITTVPLSPNSGSAFPVYSSGSVSNGGCHCALGILPVAYLKSTIKILSNPHPDLEYGSVNNPFILQ